MSLRGIFDGGGVRKQNGHWQSSNLIIEPVEEWTDIFSVPYTCRQVHSTPGYNTVGIYAKTNTLTDDIVIFSLRTLPDYENVTLTPGKYRLVIRGSYYAKPDYEYLGYTAQGIWNPGISMTLPGVSTYYSIMAGAQDINGYGIESYRYEAINTYGAPIKNPITQEQVGEITSVTGDYYKIDSSDIVVNETPCEMTLNFTVTKEFSADIDLNVTRPGGNLVWIGASTRTSATNSAGTAKICWGIALQKKN